MAQSGTIDCIRTLRHHIGAVVWWASWALLASAAPAATLRVSVADPSGAPIAGASVRVSAGSASFAATTDARGGAIVAHLPVGEITLDVQAENFIARRQTLSVRMGENHIAWQLRLAPHKDAVTVTAGEVRLRPPANAHTKLFSGVFEAALQVHALLRL